MSQQQYVLAESGHQIVLSYGDLIYGACYRILGNHHDAEDAAQDAVIRLLRSDLTAVRDMAAWAHTIAVRTAKDCIRSNLRRRARDRAAVPGAGHGSDGTCGSEDASELGESAAMLHALDAALLTLTADDADLLRQHYLLERSQREMAEQAGVSQPAIAKRLKRALERLRQAMKRGGAVVVLLSVVGALEAAGQQRAPAIVREKWQALRSEPALQLLAQRVLVCSTLCRSLRQ